MCFSHSSPESYPALNIVKCTNLSLLRKSFSKQEKKSKKTKQHLHQKTKNSLLPHLQWPKTCADVMKYCQQRLLSPAQSFLCPCVSFCLENPSVANTMKYCCEQVSLCWKKFVNIILLPASAKKVLQKQSHSASKQICKPVAQGSVTEKLS